MSLSKIIGEVKNFVGELLIWLFILLPSIIMFAILFIISQAIGDDIRNFISFSVFIVFVFIFILLTILIHFCITARFLLPIVLKYLINEKSYFSYLFYDPNKFPDFTEWKKKHDKTLFVKLIRPEYWEKHIQTVEQTINNIRQRFQR